MDVLTWQTGVLGDVLTFQRGFDITKKEQQEGPHPVISSSGFQSTHSDSKVKGPGVVIGRKGTLGNVFYSEHNFWPHDTTLWVKDFHDNNEKFSYYFLKTLHLEQYDCGASNPTINRNHIHLLPVNFPPLETQRKIASILSTYDDLIENNTRRIKTLEEMAQMIYREWFVNFRFPEHEQVKRVDSPLGMIPEGWEVKCLKDFGPIITGKTPSTKVPENFGVFMPFIKTPDMHGNMFCIETGEALSELGAASQRNKTLPPNSLCVSCIGTAGIVTITDVPAQTNQQMNSIVLNSQATREFLYFALLDLKEVINQYGANGATMVNLNKGKFEALVVVSPDSEILNAFHKLAEPCFEEIKVLQKKNRNLRQTRDLLLPKLISGEVAFS
jgi:type I restriction enzyme S subunit